MPGILRLCDYCAKLSPIGRIFLDRIRFETHKRRKFPGETWKMQVCRFGRNFADAPIDQEKPRGERGKIAAVAICHVLS